MKEIIITSKVHGKKVVLVDDKDYDNLSKHTWSLSKGASGALYVRRRIIGTKKEKIRIHRQIMGLEATSKMVVDHIDGNPLNNQRNNLRIVTRMQNCQNRRPQKNAKSLYAGVIWRSSRKTWRAFITVGYKKLCLGSYKCEHQAAYAYNYAAKSLRGEFANLNIIQSSLI